MYVALISFSKLSRTRAFPIIINSQLMPKCFFRDSLAICSYVWPDGTWAPTDVDQYPGYTCFLKLLCLQNSLQVESTINICTALCNRFPCKISWSFFVLSLRHFR